MTGPTQVPAPDPARPSGTPQGGSAADILRAAATLIEQRAAAATPGPWELEMGYLRPDVAQALFVGCNPEEACEAPGDCFDGTHGIGGFDRDEDNRWSALMSPGIAAPLAAWLRNHAAYVEAVQCSAQRDALALARALLGDQP